MKKKRKSKSDGMGKYVLIMIKVRGIYSLYYYSVLFSACYLGFDRELQYIGRVNGLLP